ncbi:glycoside hydrolase family 79 protein [Mixia osmundae IAM 14324]|uniref:Beta-glucuronidase C-terminal domain-containing protein n=1 Tax=Mixia osmundae (strain CBS 9802 / IAM 14324 / JCM 22182 / KY 12970) TaxID=764103 RepID=G7DU53_MIXOS|nr:glycoside hydrolase family 79 protein [Mixia osmundae IAM 14324]KEI40979.1 glycoside hydrolase family 79 protein [Mixia osmundae IAM 14324]GAA94113.1 hypothetical protein E5Q_00760 [Mixia osmundae IAM 14324]
MTERCLACLALLLASAVLVTSEVTIYATPTLTGAAAASATAASRQLTPPAIPPDLPKTVAYSFGEGVPVGASTTVPSNFWGWSIELSVASQILGNSPGTLQNSLLNYLSNYQARARKGTVIRIGGNSQDQAEYRPAQPVPIITNGTAQSSSSLQTPYLTMGPSLFDTMLNMTQLVQTQWIFGLNFADPANTTNPTIIATALEASLGDNLLAFQVGNEPDLYSQNGKRPVNYTIPEYIVDFGEEIELLNGTTAPTTITQVNKFTGPSVCCDWTMTDILANGYLAAYSTSLASVSVQHYPDNNCVAVGKSEGTAVVPQNVLQNYLNHTGATYLLDQYNTVVPVVQALSKPFHMLETNTASCGGFPGISDAFASALWAVDYALQMATRNFTLALFHVGGSAVVYNPFTPPPTDAQYLGWTTGPLYYAGLAVTEALGSSSASQVLDLSSTIDDVQPAYIIYEAGMPARAVLINYVTDNSGASDYTASLTISGVGDQINVKYLSAASSTAFENITWASQSYDSYDGTAQGNVSVTTAPCTNGICTVTAPAPSVAVCFFSDAILADSTPTETANFGSGTANSTTLAPAALASSNGMGGRLQPIGSSDRKSDAAKSIGNSRTLTILLCFSLFLLL